MKRSAIFFLFAIHATAQESFQLRPDFDVIGSPEITEASGVAVSPRSENFLWIINDSGGSAEIHLCTTDGKPRGSVRLAGVKNKDWEDLAGFVYRGESYLLVADTGDNQSRRSSVSLLIVREPSLPPTGESIAGEIPVSWRIDFTYEGGPRDCEAVAVDSSEGKILLISKRTTPPEVYELPLKPAARNPVAKRIGTTRTTAPSLNFIPFANQPTGLDISADGAAATIVTYYGVFLFPRAKGMSWDAALAAEPLRIGSHKLPQAEAVAFSKDGGDIFCVTEGKHSPIAHFQKIKRGE